MLPTGVEVLTEGAVLERLAGGLAVTAGVAFSSIAISTGLGLLIGLLRTLPLRLLRFCGWLHLELFRIIPILVWLFIVYFGIPNLLDIHLDGRLVAVAVFSLWGAAELGDIVRGALTSLPVHQVESGKALGLSFWQLYRYILLPQAVRRLVPGAINLATRMVKTTSLIVFIGVADVVKIGQQVIERSILTVPMASFWVYGLIFVLYFCLCYPLSRWAKHLETKWEG